MNNRNKRKAETDLNNPPKKTKTQAQKDKHNEVSKAGRQKKIEISNIKNENLKLYCELLLLLLPPKETKELEKINTKNTEVQKGTYLASQIEYLKKETNILRKMIKQHKKDQPITNTINSNNNLIQNPSLFDQMPNNDIPKYFHTPRFFTSLQNTNSAPSNSNANNNLVDANHFVSPPELNNNNENYLNNHLSSQFSNNNQPVHVAHTPRFFTPSQNTNQNNVNQSTSNLFDLNHFSSHPEFGGNDDNYSDLNYHDNYNLNYKSHF